MTPRDGFAFLENGCGAVKPLDVFQKLAARREIEGPNGALDPWNQRRASAKFVYAEANEQRSQRDIASHLSANANPDILRVRGRNRHPNQTDDCGMSWFVKMGDVFV
jgi:hypothetical protein